MYLNIEVNHQYQRNTNVIIDGIPDTVDHIDLENIVLTLFNNVCFHSITTRDIVACHRLSKESTSVIVKFLNSKDATALLDSRKSISSLNNTEIGLEQCSKFYVAEHLCPYMARLAFRCRCLKREELIEKTKIQKGVVKILIRNNVGVLSWINITHIDNLTKLFPDFNFEKFDKKKNGK